MAKALKVGDIVMIKPNPTSSNKIVLANPGKLGKVKEVRIDGYGRDIAKVVPLSGSFKTPGGRYDHVVWELSMFIVL
jgi:hypothetical protein